MNVSIKKIDKLQGNLTARPSKSFAHRYLLAAALSENESTISNVDFSNDIVATLNCIHAYGKKHFRDFEAHTVKFSDGFTKSTDPTFDCKESGTTLRIFMPIAIAKYEKANFIGSDRLIERGVSVYEDLFKYVTFHKDKYNIETKGTFSAGKFTLPGNISSQYISGLLYTLPLFDTESELIINTNLESKNYVLMTLDVLNNYGIKIETNLSKNSSDTTDTIYFKIPGNQKYMARDFQVEGDYSNAAFIDAFNYFDSSINLSGLNPNSLQSDKIYKKHFDDLDKGFSEIDISDCIDLGPILVTFAALKNGARFVNTARLKIKESDRGAVIAEELKKCNANIKVLDNEIIVEKATLSKPISSFNSHNDHRIAMSLSLISTFFDIEISDAEAVNKSYPGYFDDLKILGANIS